MKDALRSDVAAVAVATKADFLDYVGVGTMLDASALETMEAGLMPKDLVSSIADGGFALHVRFGVTGRSRMRKLVERILATYRFVAWEDGGDFWAGVSLLPPTLIDSIDGMRTFGVLIDAKALGVLTDSEPR